MFYPSRTVFTKSKNSFSGQTMRHTNKMLRNKIVCFKKIYEFYFDHFLVKRTAFVLSIKNGFYKIKKLHILAKLCGIQTNVKKWNCLSQKNQQIVFWPFFGKSHGFCFIDQERFLQNQKNPFPPKLCEIQKNVKKWNCSSQKNLQIWLRPFFGQSHGFYFLFHPTYFFRNIT